MTSKPQFVLALSCPDRPGIVHRVSGFLVEQGANILEAAQFDDVSTGRFFMRVQFELDDATVAATTLRARFAATGGELAMQANFYPTATRVRTLIMVSKQGHCLNSLLHRWEVGTLPTIPPRAQAAGKDQARREHQDRAVPAIHWVWHIRMSSV